MWIPAILAIAQLIPVIAKTVGILTKQVEPESPVGGGAAQKQAVVGLVKAGMDAADKLTPDGEVMTPREKEVVVEIADKATDLMVDLYNATGTFTKSNGKQTVDVEGQLNVSAAA